MQKIEYFCSEKGAVLCLVCSLPAFQAEGGGGGVRLNPAGVAALGEGRSFKCLVGVSCVVVYYSLRANNCSPRRRRTC